MRLKRNENKMTDEKLETEKHEKQIDEDFKTFPITSRLIRLEKSWIRDLSHKIISKGKSFVHNDRKEMRNKLFKHLKKKN